MTLDSFIAEQTREMLLELLVQRGATERQAKWLLGCGIRWTL